MRIVLFGKSGQVGRALQQTLAPLGDVVAADRETADLRDIDALRRFLDRAGAGIVVNAAAYTDVDRAEAEPEAAHAVNAEASGAMAEAVAASGGLLVHYSTDYVFDGSKPGYYAETDTPAPLGVYGSSKLAGEQAIAGSKCRHLILRTSWVHAPRGRNFPATMLRLAAERDTLSVVGDQLGAPTGAELIAEVTATMLGRLGRDAALAARASGLYHLAAAGETSWHGLARFVIAEALSAGARLKCTPERVAEIATADYPTAARRPLNSRLDTDKLRRAFDVTLPDWRVHVRRTVQAIITREAA